MASNRDWCSLPAELLDLVSGHLASERDILHVRQVCTHWRAAVTRPAAPFRPWIVASRTRPSSELGPNGEYSLWLPRGVRRVELPVPPGLPYCRGTSHGWLALTDDMWSPKRLVLWEPRTGAEIALPPMPLVIQVFLTGDPLGSQPSGWMAIATHMTVSVDNKVSFWRPGDGAWSSTARGGRYNDFPMIQSVAFQGGKMYCIESMSRIAVYDLSRVDAAAASQPVLLDTPFINYDRAAHFVACNGDLLFVLLPRHTNPNFPDVYNLGPQGMITTGRHLQELDLRKEDMLTDLGGYSLFLGRGETFALSAKEHPAIRGNCIYYIPLEHHGFNRKDWSWAFVFDLESRAVDEIKFPPEHVENREVRWWPCSWFCPQKPVLLKHR